MLLPKSNDYTLFGTRFGRLSDNSTVYLQHSLMLCKNRQVSIDILVTYSHSHRPDKYVHSSLIYIYIHTPANLQSAKLAIMRGLDFRHDKSKTASIATLCSSCTAEAAEQAVWHFCQHQKVIQLFRSLFNWLSIIGMEDSDLAVRLPSLSWMISHMLDAILHLLSSSTDTKIKTRRMAPRS